MSQLTVLPVAIPMLVAAILMGGQPLLHRRLIDAAGIATAAVVLILCGWLAWGASTGPIITWAGNWRPREGVALGVAFVVDPIGAGLACLCATLATASLLFSWRYFKAAGALYHALMLVFLAGMVGFCLTGDLFNMFVFFELMSVAAYALTGYKIEEEKSLEGALNFAIVNSVGAFLILIGIGLLYGRTGALNLAQIGRELAARPVDGLVVASCVLILSGLAVKGALVPFHFWLADAHAVAPTPVCVLFSGVMVELGIYGIARVFWTIYAGPLGPHREAVGGIFLVAGAASTVVGGVMCLAQRHIKRLLAFSTISHMGMLLIAIGLMDAPALAGGAIYTVAHGLVKGALFLLAGTLLHCLGSVDELELRGAGRRLPWTGLAFGMGVVGLAGLPPFGTGLGKSLIEAAGRRTGHEWIVIPLIAGSAMTAAGVLRVVARVFLGWGPRVSQGEDSTPGDEMRETRSYGGRAPWVMLAPATALLILGGLTGLISLWTPAVDDAARRFTDFETYQVGVLDGIAGPPVTRVTSLESPHVGILAIFLTASVALGLAILSLFGDGLPAQVRRAASCLDRLSLRPIRGMHSGKAGDYVAWLTVGVGAFGVVLAILTGVLRPR